MLLKDDDVVQRSAVQLHAVVESRYSPAHSPPHPILPDSTKIQVYYSHVLPCTGLYRATHVFPGAGAPGAKQASVVEVADRASRGY